MIEQGTPEWRALRLGKATASRMADLTSRTRNGWGASRANYMAEKVVERLTNTPADGYISADMQWGIDNEPHAISAYTFITDREIRRVGFVDHPHIAMSGASPDGLVESDGLAEFKCPKTATHINFLLSGKIEGKYIKQMQFQMACTQRQWCDFVSFDPRLPVELQIKICRIEADPTMIAELESQVATFLRELDDKLATLQKIREDK